MNTSALVEFPQPFSGKLEERCGGFLDCALKRLEVDDEIQALLHSSYREMKLELPLRTSDEQIRLFHGFRGQHEKSRGLQTAHITTELTR